MACGGVIASAGAQMDNFVMTVKSRSSGKSTFFGHSSAYSGSSLSDSTIELKRGSEISITTIEDLGGSIQMTLGSAVADDANSFNKIIIGDLTLTRVSASFTNSNQTISWATSDDAISSANNSTVNIEVRAD